MHSILLVEDESNLGETLRDYLNDKNYQCHLAESAESARKLFHENEFQIILMDINLPDGDGISLAKELRQLKQDFLLIFLSAQNDPETKYHGLEMGAEDYITKPFDLRELTLRLEKALKTHQVLSQKEDEITLGSLKIYFKKYLVIDANKNEIPLGQKECAILELLYTHKNEVVSRDEIIENVWGENAFPTNRTVDNYIVKLRKWLETDPSGATQINTIRGVGYKLESTKESNE